MYLLLARIDNNNNNVNAHFGYVHHMNNTLSQSADTMDDKRSNRLSSSVIIPPLIRVFRVSNHPRVSLCRNLLRGDCSGVSLIAGTAEISKAILVSSG
jgi:hypothetical protein